MSELTSDLRALGASIDYPPTPTLAPRVRRRIEAEPARRLRLPRRRALVLALAVAALAVAGALAVPPARTAILRLFGIGGVTIERVETLPAARERPLTTGFGRPLTRAQAERRAAFRILLPPFEGETASRFYAGPGFAAVALEHDGEELLLTELRGDQFGFAKKFATAGTRMEFLRVKGGEAVWLEGAPHVVIYALPTGELTQRTVRISGNVLIWRRGPLTLRLEGELERDEAIAIAERVR